MRRSRLEIYIDTLKVINRGINRPTKIMYATNTSWAPIQEVLNKLQQQELIREKRESGHTVYLITEKGKNCLKVFNELPFAMSSNHFNVIESLREKTLVVQKIE
ncbi:DUF4364 family protein [Candidatus Bathyarchaeota archaeon]|nr:DUF4364 family protein [Candidatus Bathyarchaeota archaeon]